jgi:hypothetical protein
LEFCQLLPGRVLGPGFACWYGTCYMEAANGQVYASANAVAATNVGAQVGSTLSVIDESYPEIEVHATLVLYESVYSDSRPYWRGHVLLMSEYRTGRRLHPPMPY